MIRSVRFRHRCRPAGIPIFAALGTLAFLASCAQPSPVPDRDVQWTGETVTLEITAERRMVALDEHVGYDGFTFNRTIPSEQFIVQQGDSVRMVLHNEDTVAHGLSVHAADAQTSAHVGNVPPGESREITFLAKYPGVFMYHCAPGGHGIMMHTKAGQHGMIVVEPANGRYGLEAELGREPDLRLYFVQHEVYRDGRDFFDGKALYVMFNGELFRYVKNPIQARPGDYVRFYYLNVGPNLTSTFHIVGGIFDYMHFQGNPQNVEIGGQSVTSGPTDSWVIEWEIPEEEGGYLLVTHAFGTQTAKGAIGILQASHDAERDAVVRSEGPRSNGELDDTQFRRVVRPFAPGSPEVDRPVRFDAGEEVIIEMVGNSYVPKTVEIPSGTSVTWVNEDVFDYMNFEQTGLHNSVVVEGPEDLATEMLAHGQTDALIFTVPGDYEYICTMHPYMRGIIRVR